MRNLIKKYKNLDIKIKASLWFVICSCFQKLVAFITTPIYTRLMTKTQYGEYTLFLSWIEFFSIICTMNIFYSAYTVGLNKYENDKDKYTGNVHLICFILTTIVSLILLLNIDFFASLIGLSSNYLIAIIAYMYIMPTFQIWASQQRYFYKYKMLVFVTMLLGIFTVLLGSILTLFLDDKGFGAASSKVIVETIISIPLFVLNIKRLCNFFNTKYLKSSIKYSLVLIPHYLSTMILNHSDRIMISQMCGSDKTAIYSVAYSIGMVVSVIITALLNAFVPWLYRKLKNNDYSGITFCSIFLTSIAAIFTLLLILVAPEIMLILVPDTYGEAIWVLAPVAIGTLLTVIYGLFVNIEFFYHFNKFIILSSIFAAILNILLNYIFIGLYGYIAAGYTTAVCYFALLLFHYLSYRIMLKVKKIKCNILSIIPHLIIFGASLLLSVVFMVLYNFSFVYRYIMLILIIICFIVFRKKILSLLKSIKWSQL